MSQPFFVYKLKRLPRHHRNREEKIEYLKKYGLWEELQDNPRFLEYLLSADKRSQTSLAGTNEDSVCVLAGIDRNQNIYIKPACVGGLETTHVTKHFDERFEPDAILVTDGNSTYNWFAELNMIHHEAIPADKHAVGPYNLARVNALHGNYKAYYPKHKQNLPATKYLDLGTDFFWWLEKNKDKTTQEKVDILYKMMKEETSSVKYRDLTHRKLSLLKDVVIHNKDNSYTEYSGDGCIFTLFLSDGTHKEITAFYPFLVIDGTGYKTKHEPCEALRRYANELSNGE